MTSHVTIGPAPAESADHRRLPSVGPPTNMAPIHPTATARTRVGKHSAW